jgi:hypothetical protein
MSGAESWLRACYWIGAILDAKAALILLFPKLVPPLYRSLFDGGKESGEGPSPFRLIAVFSFSWTCVLLWADRMPIERKGILLVALPLFLGLLSFRAASALRSRMRPFCAYNVFTALLFALGILFGYSYWINS